MYRKIVSSILAGIVAVMFSATVFAARININTADAAALAEGITGVGPKIAEQIIKWRQEHGPFESIDQLAEIKGVGPKIIENNRANIVLEGSSE